MRHVCMRRRVPRGYSVVHKGQGVIMLAPAPTASLLFELRGTYHKYYYTFREGYGEVW